MRQGIAPVQQRPEEDKRKKGTRKVNEQKPKLMALPEDGNACKPDELDGETIIILDCMNTVMPDGRETSKWVVRRASGDTKIYWSAGQNPTLQVRDWFRNWRNQPLYCRIYRQANQYGTAVWKIEQLEEDGTPASDGQLTIDDQLAKVGL